MSSRRPLPGEFTCHPSTSGTQKDAVNGEEEDDESSSDSSSSSSSSSALSFSTKAAAVASAFCNSHSAKFNALYKFLSDGTDGGGGAMHFEQLIPDLFAAPSPTSKSNGKRAIEEVDKAEDDEEIEDEEEELTSSPEEDKSPSSSIPKLTPEKLRAGLEECLKMLGIEGDDEDGLEEEDLKAFDTAEMEAILAEGRRMLDSGELDEQMAADSFNFDDYLASWAAGTASSSNKKTKGDEEEQ